MNIYYMMLIVYCESFNYLHVPTVILSNYINLREQYCSYFERVNCQAKMILFYSVGAKTFDS